MTAGCTSSPPGASAPVSGGPYPADVPPALEEVHARRDTSGGAHRDAHVGLISRVTDGYAGLAEAVYEQVLRPEGWLPYRDTRRVIETLLAHELKVGIVSNIAFDLRPILLARGLEALPRACTLSFEFGATKPDRAQLRGRRRPARHGAARDPDGRRPSRRRRGCGGARLLPMTPPGTEHGLDAVLRRLDLG